MDVKVVRWPGDKAPTESLIREMMGEEGLQPYRWSNGPGDIYAAHTHPYHKVIYVVEGSITFGFPADGTATTLHAGDRLELPPGLAHDAVVGTRGVACLEAHRLLGASEL